MAPSKSSPKSSAASDQPEKISVFDFLYYDARRVGSFLGQFDPSGHLQGVEVTADTGRSEGSKVTTGASGGVPLAATVTGSTEGNSERHWDRGARKTFDPLWGNAVAFLDYLTQRDLIAPDSATARIGQLVLISGRLSIVDMSMLKTFLDNPTLRKQIVGATTAAAGPRQAKAQQQSGAETGVALFSALPHVIQARFFDDSAGYWSSLNADGLAVSLGDLFLRHGINIAGTWSMVGILDALPEGDLAETQQLAQNVTNIAELGFYAGALANMAPTVRPILGRPADAFGITPLLIFREVA